MKSIVRPVLVVAVIVVLCQLCTTGRKTYSRNEQRELEEIEEVLQLYLKETEEEATVTITEAIIQGKKKDAAFKKNQKKFRERGTDGGKKRGRRHRLNKVNKKFLEDQEKAVTVLDIKKSLVELTDKPVRECAKDPTFKKVWDKLVKAVPVSTEKRNSHSRYARATDTSVCDTSTVTCSEVPNVDTYRTMNGECNNKDNPTWGAAGSAQRRWLDEVYADSVNTERVSALDGSALPGVRDISNAVFKATDTETPGEGFNTLMSLNWGQFLDHDIVLTPTYTGDNGADITCCTDTARDECMDIIMTPDEDLNITCMEFVRSLPATDCSLTGKQVTNSITSYIDGSAVYGSSDTELAALRTTGALLDTSSSTDGKGLLPVDSGDDAICSLDGNDATDFCQAAGDVRCNVQPGLGSLHLLFVREHNRIVTELKAVKTWTDEEELFSVTRKIIGAIIQHITYNEYFGNLFNSDLMTEYGLNLQESGFSTDYDSTVDAGIGVGFATAAYRFGHSQIPEIFAYMDDDFTTVSDVTSTTDVLKNPHMLISNAGSDILKFITYMTTLDARKADTEFTDSIRNKLFNTNSDLSSLNLQRGRDHGLPSYTKWRELCGLSVPSADSHTSWSELVDLKGEPRKAFKELYKSVHDIDLFAGGMTEKRIAGTYVGNTFACILGMQFQKLKRGDRFWYERDGTEGFTEDQLTEIRKVTLSGLMCNNFGLDTVQANSFKQPLHRKPCSRIDQMDFGQWNV